MYGNQQIEKYLDRIRYGKTPTVSGEALDDLIYAHQCAIPFENLDVYDFRREIRLDGESLFEKMVTRRRGGYCFETNGLFFHMLKAIGFDVYPCLCRVMFGCRHPRENLIDHRASIVRLDGERYFCEAGIGGAMPPGALRLPPESPEAISPAWESARPPLPGEVGGCDGRTAFDDNKPPLKGEAPPKAADGVFAHAAQRKSSADANARQRGGQVSCLTQEQDRAEWQEMRGEHFRVGMIERGWYGTIRRVDAKRDIYDDPMSRRERLEVMFCDAAAHERDFTALNYYLSRSGESMFRKRRIVNLRTPEGYRALTNDVYREVARGRKTETPLAPEEIPAVLKEKFGIEVNEPLRLS